MTDFTVDELDESLLQLLPELLTPQRPAIRPSRSRSRRTTSRQSSANSNTSSTGHRQLSSNDNISGTELTENNGHISASEQTVQQPVHSIPECHDQFPASSPPRSDDSCPIPRSNTAPVKFRVPIRRSNSVYTTTFSFKIKPRNKVTRSSSIGSTHAPLRIKVLVVRMSVCLFTFLFHCLHVCLSVSPSTDYSGNFFKAYCKPSFIIHYQSITKVICAII